MSAVRALTADALRTITAQSASELPPLLHALWQEAHGNWDEAHALAQDVDTPDGAWVHAYLHRREGDPGNAAYWYRRAGKPICVSPAADEWQSIANDLLAGSSL